MTTTRTLAAQGVWAEGPKPAGCCPAPSLRLWEPSRVPSSPSEGPTTEQHLFLSPRFQRWQESCRGGEASPAHIQLQGALGVGGHDPGGHAEGHSVCEDGHLGQGLGGNEDSVVLEPPNWSPKSLSPYPSPQCRTYPHVHQADAERDQPREISIGEGEPLHIEVDLLLPWLPLDFVGQVPGPQHLLVV